MEVLIYAAVCREEFEPATACRVASELGIRPDTIYDLSNACLGVLNGIVDIANRIELGQVRAGLVVSCETAREINDAMIETMLQSCNMDVFKTSLATLTGGSGAVAVLVTDGSFCPEQRRRLLGGTMQAEPQYYGLCRWGLEGMLSAASPVHVHRFRRRPPLRRRVGSADLEAFLSRLGWAATWWTRSSAIRSAPATAIRSSRRWGSRRRKSYSTYPFLGNMGTVSLPLTAALAEEREFLRPGDRVGFLGIGSGLNCLMLGVDW